MTIDADTVRTKLPKFASHFRASELETLLEVLDVDEVPAGQVLVRDGGDADSVYLVLEGRLVAYLESHDASIELGHVGPGEWVGEVSLLDNASASASVQAEIDSKVLSMTQQQFADFNDEHPEVAGIVLRLLTQLMITRLRAADDLLLRRPGDAAGDRSTTQAMIQWSVNAYRRLIGATEHSA